LVVVGVKFLQVGLEVAVRVVAVMVKVDLVDLPEEQEHQVKEIEVVMVWVEHHICVVVAVVQGKRVVILLQVIHHMA
jgi:hypothetical protein